MQTGRALVKGHLAGPGRMLCVRWGARGGGLEPEPWRPSGSAVPQKVLAPGLASVTRSVSRDTVTSIRLRRWAIDLRATSGRHRRSLRPGLRTACLPCCCQCSIQHRLRHPRSGSSPRTVAPSRTPVATTAGTLPRSGEAGGRARGAAPIWLQKALPGRRHSRQTRAKGHRSPRPSRARGPAGPRCV